MGVVGIALVVVVTLASALLSEFITWFLVLRKPDHRRRKAELARIEADRTLPSPRRCALVVWNSWNRC